MFKKGVVINTKRIKTMNFDGETIILFSLFLCGIILGIFLVKNCNDEIRDALSTILRNYISAKSENGFWVCFSGVSVFLIIFIILSFLFGLCAVGTPFIWFLPVVFGAGCSSYVSLMLINYGFKGLFYCVIVDLLPYAITTATLVKCCCESTRLSVNLFGCIAGENALKGKNQFKEYIFNYLIFCIPVLLGSIISAFFFKIFQGLFIFT